MVKIEICVILCMCVACMEVANWQCVCAERGAGRRVEFEKLETKTGKGEAPGLQQL